MGHTSRILRSAGTGKRTCLDIRIEFRAELHPAFERLPGLPIQSSGIDIARPFVFDLGDTRKRLQTDPGGPWLTIAQVARELGVHVSTVYALVENGSIPAKRLRSGRRPWMFVGRADLDALKVSNLDLLFAGKWTDPYRLLQETPGGPWLSVRQVADLLGLSVRQVLRLVGKATFAVRRITGRHQGVYISQRDVDAFIASRAASLLDIRWINRRPESQDGQWLTTGQFAERAGMTRNEVRRGVGSGAIPATCVTFGSRTWSFIHEREISRLQSPTPRLRDVV